MTARLLISLVVLCSHASAQQSFPEDLPGTLIGSSLGVGFEASGAVWHERLQCLFVVGDDGELAKLDASGNVLNLWPLPGGPDLEAVCVADPETDFVYLGLEHPDSILEFNLTSGLVERSFNLISVMQGPNKKGLEALTFLPDAMNAEGGLFYAGLQNDGKVYSFELPIRSSATATTFLHVATLTLVPGRTDLSALTYDRNQQRLYAVFDSSERITVATSDGTVIEEWVLPGINQEGIALRGCRLFVAWDSGPIVWTYDSFPDTGQCTSLDASITEISLSVGGIQNLLLDAGSSQSNKFYWIFGSFSGTTPGLDFGAGLILPLNFDSYLNLTLTKPGFGAFSDFRGTLDANGAASAGSELACGFGPHPGRRHALACLRCRNRTWSRRLCKQCDHGYATSLNRSTGHLLCLVRCSSR